MSRPLPKSLNVNPFLDSWLRFDCAKRRVHLFSGKVEIGQGAMTAIAQIAAHELALSMRELDIVSGCTERAPNEGLTSGSYSVEVGGTSMRMACAQARTLLIAAASRQLATAPEHITVADGMFLVRAKPSNLSYWDVAGEVDFHQPVTGEAPFRAINADGLIGKPVPRLDLPAKLAGSGFIHDLALKDMVHARVIRPCSPKARILSVNDVAARARPGVIAVIRAGSFLAVVAKTEEGALSAAKELSVLTVWKENARLPGGSPVTEWLPALPTQDEIFEIRGADLPPVTGGRKFSATFSRPVLAHASIGPSCGLALLENGGLTVWTHSQGVYSLRDQIARVLGMSQAAVTVHHMQGAGCYGHNGADDAAFDAAFLAHALPGRPIRVQWSREDELSASPFGSAMVIKTSATLDRAGKIAEWEQEVWSGAHSQRPGSAGQPNLLATTEFEPPWPMSEPADPPFETGGGGLRNAISLYDIPRYRLKHHFVKDMPVRVSALRSLGAFANVFATESFIDELAEAAGVDPVAFRLDNLSDPRARAVVGAVAEMAGWRYRDEAVGEGRARGIGFARYKGRAAYGAVIAEVVMEEGISVSKIWCAVDSGLVINSDGLANQVEGGIIQSLSWTLKEGVRFDGARILSTNWEEYPILGFAEIPDIEVRLMNNPDEPPLGSGELAAGPTAAAVGNAVARALGVRVRDLPITRDRVMNAASL